MANRLLSLLCGLGGLGLSVTASAQTFPTTSAPASGGTTVAAEVRPPLAATPSAISPQSRSYGAVHDSLQRLVAGVRAEVESRATLFKATQGTFGGLHQRVRSYAKPGHRVKKQIIKGRFGPELEQRKYYDERGRLVLSERYVGRQLTRLELRQYEPGLALSAPMTTWLLVRGGYLRVETKPGCSRAGVLPA